MGTKNLTKKQVIKLAEYFNGYYEQRPIIDAIKANNFSEALVWTRRLKPGTKHEQDKLDELEKAIKNYSICGEPDTSICEQESETCEQNTETVNEQETSTAAEPDVEIADEPENADEQETETSKYSTKDPVEQVVEASKPKRRRKSAE